jgi:hypothetical protein
MQWRNKRLIILYIAAITVSISLLFSFLAIPNAFWTNNDNLFEYRSSAIRETLAEERSRTKDLVIEVYRQERELGCRSYMTPDNLEILCDENGTEMVDYRGYLGNYEVYNPVAIRNPEWFLSNYEEYNGTSNGDYYVIPYSMNWEYNGVFLESPLYSCEAQGQALVVTALEYEITHDERYKLFAKKVAASFAYEPFNDDGWLRGLIHPAKPPGYILNSHMKCLIELHIYYEISGDNSVLPIFERGIKVLEENIDYYTTEEGTRYDRLTGEWNRRSYTFLEYGYSWMLDSLVQRSGSAKLKETLEYWNIQGSLPDDEVRRMANYCTIGIILC